MYIVRTYLHHNAHISYTEMIYGLRDLYYNIYIGIYMYIMQFRMRIRMTFFLISKICIVEPEAAAVEFLRNTMHLNHSHRYYSYKHIYY